MSHGNTLYCGDNLQILREYFADESVDLIYLDPPFNSRRTYSALLKDEGGNGPPTQIAAFDDVWHWDGAAEGTYQELITSAPVEIGNMVSALHRLIGANQMMAYLVMMAARLVELHRVLRPTGSLYLHCDPKASHYIRVVLDTVFGVRNFRNEIVWKRTNAHNDARKKFADLSDILYFYTKGREYTFHTQHLPYSEDYVRRNYRHRDEDGRRYALRDLRSPNPRPNLTYTYKGYQPHRNGWSISESRMAQLDAEGRLHFPRKKTGRIRLKCYLDEMPGVPAGNVWDDVLPIQASSAERVGYPTQKPLKLLERIISASSDEGDLVLDPFCGGGTAIHAAQKLNRKWIGIDTEPLAITIQKRRLRDAFNIREGADYTVTA